MALEKQMELFDEGGLMQEGGQIDPVSGNDVPVGSTKEEVRDDIPAQLSEGEFVMPADVVRYHGLDKMMALRQEAKIGLKKMEQMGMMGNSDEATLPDDIPFDINDIDMEDDVQEFAVGGMPQPYGVIQSGATGIQGYQPSMYQNLPTTGPILPPPPPAPPAPPQAPTQAYTPTMQPPATLPTFGEMVIPTYVTYVNELGYELQIPVDQNGNPLIPVPAGYKKKPAAEEQPTTPETTPPPTTVTETDRGDGKSPQELAEEAARREQVNARKAAAKELGYTKQQSIGEALLSLTPLGFMVGDPEVGTVMADGTIADGQGNSFDPITGKQVGFSGGIIGNIAGGLGLRDTEAQKFGLPEGSPIPESSLAGLKSQMGETGIQAALAGTDAASVAKSTEAGYQSPISNEMIDAAVKAGLGTREQIVANIEATRPGTARVATTLGQTSVTSAAKAEPTTVSQAATQAPMSKGVVDAMKDLQNTISQGKLSGRQLDNFLSDVIAQRAGTTVGLGSNVEVSYTPEATDSLAADYQIAAAKIKDQQSALEKIRSNIQKATTEIPTDELTFRNIESTVAAEKAAQARTLAEQSRMQQGQLGAKTTAQAQREAGEARETRGQTRTESFESRQDYKDNVSSYERQGYSSSAAREAGANKTRADDEAMNQTGDYSGRTSAVTDSSGNAVRTGSGGVVTNTAPDDDSGSSSNDKIICTAMNNAYGFGSFRQTVWLQHSKNMHPAYQKGYHRIFKPLIKVAYKDEKWYNIALRKTLEGIARRRTADIWMQKHGKRHFLGAIERAILEPICYIVGKIK